MTISSTTMRAAAAGNGVTTAFSYPYRFLADADLDVYIDGTLKTLTTHYTVTGAGDPSGGTVTFLTAPANGTEVVIVNNPDATQSLDLVDNDPLPAGDLEAALDRLTLLVQRERDQRARALVLADSDTSTADLVLPSPTATYYLRWNSAGTALENVASLSTVTVAVSPFTESLLDETSASAWRTALGLGTLAIQDAASVVITGGNLTGVTITNAATLPAATETYAGAVEKATAAEARAFTAEKFLDAERLRDAFNATGSAPFYAARAWVNFNGTGTVAIRASGNVTSITDSGVGQYVVNFTTALPDANYACVGTAARDDDADQTENDVVHAKSPATGSVVIHTTDDTAGLVDTARVNVVIFR